MARYGKQPIQIANGVTVKIDDGVVVVTGPKGEVSKKMPRNVEIEINEKEVVIGRAGGGKQSLANQGTVRSHVANMVKGVTDGWSKSLEIVGAGYRAEIRGSDLVMQIGYSHPVVINIPKTMTAKVEKSTIVLSGPNKEEVTHLAALVRGSRPPEPYKGTGIKYSDEIIRRKAGKQASK